MADVNFGPAHAIEFWYITRHGFDHKASSKHHANKKEENNEHHKQEQKNVQQPKENKKENQHAHEQKNVHKKELEGKDAPKSHYNTPNFGHANHLLYWWVTKHEASAQKEFHHRAAHDHAHPHADQHSEQPKPAAPKGNAKAKKGDNNSKAETTSREVPAAAAAAAAASSESAPNGAAKKKKKKKPAKKELKEPTGELQTATTPEQVRDFLARHQNFSIADSVADLAESCTKLPHTQALHLAKVLATASAPLVSLNLAGSNLQAAGATALQPFLAKTTTVKKIDLSDCSLHDDGAGAFVVGLARNAQSAVVSLNLANNKLTHKSIPAIAALVGNSSTFLHSLTLDGNDFSGSSEDAIKHLLMSLARPIDHLSLRAVKLPAEAGLLFGTWMSKRPPVRSLILADNNLGDRAAISIVSEAANNSNLAHLDLSKNGIGNKAYDEFTRLFLKRAIAPSTVDLADNTMGRLNEGKLKTLLKKNHETQQQIQAREAKQKS